MAGENSRSSKNRPVQGGNIMEKCEILLALSDKAPHQSMTIGAFLEDKGYQVAVMDSGSAIEILQKKNFDLVITNLLAVLEKAKELNSETMAILVLDTRCKSIPTAHAIQSSADDFLFKPFELTELEMRVIHCIEGMELKQKNVKLEWVEQGFNDKILNMVKIMSHDIRGSLLSISATLKLLSRGYYGKIDEGVGNGVKELIAKTIGLIGITEEYLGRSFTASDDSETQGEALDLVRDIFIPILKELSPELKGHHLLIEPHLLGMSKKQIPLTANRIWLKMVFRNLLKNAIKYGDREGTIAIGFKDNGSSYQLNVYNSGKPIPEEYREKLFTKFMGIGNSQNRKERANGTGLGLYLIKNAIQKLGGEIRYEAREDGSNFIFTIPARPTFSVDSSLPIGIPLRLATADN